MLLCSWRLDCLVCCIVNIAWEQLHVSQLCTTVWNKSQLQDLSGRFCLAGTFLLWQQVYPVERTWSEQRLGLNYNSQLQGGKNSTCQEVELDHLEGRGECRRYGCWGWKCYSCNSYEERRGQNGKGWPNSFPWKMFIGRWSKRNRRVVEGEEYLQEDLGNSQRTQGRPGGWLWGGRQKHIWIIFLNHS